MIKSALQIFLLLLLPQLILGESSANVAPIFTVVIDAGHGAHDSGALGKLSKEKDLALKVALKLSTKLKANGVKVVMTRTTDKFIPLYERIGLANKVKAHLFISIHCNSMPLNKRNRASIRGTETFVSGFGRLDEQDIALRENASILLEKDYKKNYAGYDPKDPESYIILSLMKNAFRTQSIQFASLIQKEFKRSGRIDRSVHEKSLAVLARAAMPAVLTEIGFISSPAEEQYMRSASGQNEIVTDLSNAVLAYKKSVKY